MQLPTSFKRSSHNYQVHGCEHIPNSCFKPSAGVSVFSKRMTLRPPTHTTDCFNILYTVTRLAQPSRYSVELCVCRIHFGLCLLFSRHTYKHALCIRDCKRLDDRCTSPFTSTVTKDWMGNQLNAAGRPCDSRQIGSKDTPWIIIIISACVIDKTSFFTSQTIVSSLKANNQRLCISGEFLVQLIVPEQSLPYAFRAL
jgi:hypothetical protein